MSDSITATQKKQSLIKISTKNMPREEWLEERMKGIGGSEAATVVGLNPYSSPYSMWAEKTRKIKPEDISDKEVIRLGTDLENYVAERFMEETGKKVRRENYILRNPDYPYAAANIDRWVIGENAGLECKTSSSWEMAKQCRDGEIPKNYYCQCVHYMMVTGADRWYLGILCFGSGFYLFTVERNDSEIEALADAEKEFWDLVQSDTPPAMDGSEATTDALKTIFNESIPGSKADLTAVGHHIESYNAITAQIKELEQMQAEHENCIKEFMGTAESGTYGNVNISWKSSARKTFDKASFEKVHGEIPDEYYKTSESRSFRVTIKKEK